jgi:Protein of unknown function (DUF2971)
MILYKYLQPARIDVLEQRMIRFTQPGDFNDPFEFRPYIQSAAADDFVRESVEANFEEILNTELAKYGALLPPNIEKMMAEIMPQNKAFVFDYFRRMEPEVLKSLAPSIDAILNKNVGIMCLSEVPDSILMWGHYTDDHRGFVLGFDSDHEFFSRRRSQQDEFGFLRRVNYQKERPKVVLSDTSSPVWFNTKSEQWAYEKEWRILRVLSGADCRKNGTSFPICLFEFPEDAVLEIIIGLRSPPPLIQQLESIIRKFPRATLLQAQENPTEYSLILTRTH